MFVAQYSLKSAVPLVTLSICNSAIVRPPLPVEQSLIPSSPVPEQISRLLPGPLVPIPILSNTPLLLELIAP